MDKKSQIKQLINTPIEQLTKENLAIREVFDNAVNKFYSQGEIKHLLKNSPVEFFKDIIEFLVKEERVSIEDIPVIFLEDYEIAVLYAKQDIGNMAMLPQHYQDNEDFIYEVTYTDGRILYYASNRVKNMEYIVNSALKNTKQAFKYIPEIYKTKENCLFALSGDYFQSIGKNWCYMPLSLSLDENFIKEAGTISPMIYQYLDSTIKDKYNITEFFLSKEGSNLKYASEELKNNPNLVQPVVQKTTSYLRFAGNILKNDPEFVFPIVKRQPYEIHECGVSIKNNIEIATYLCNIRSSTPAIEFFSDEIKENSTIAMISILSTPESMNYISKKLSSDFDFVSLFIEQKNFNPVALYYISDTLKSNATIMMKAYDRDQVCLEYIGKNLKNDDEFLTYIFSNPKDNHNKPISSFLFKNLKTLQLGFGDEKALLKFAEHSGIELNSSIKGHIFNAIKDYKFANFLQQQPDLYGYLKAAVLKADLENKLEQNEIKTTKLKI